MPEMFDEGPEAADFALPGDQERLASMGFTEEATPAAPAPAAADPAEPEPAAPAADQAAAPETPDAPEEPAAEPVTIGDLTIDDPVVLEYLEKNGGDLAKALKSAAHQTELIGRQGQELGELRRAVEEGFSTIEADRQAAARPQYDVDALGDWFADNPTKIPEVAAAAFYQGEQAVLDAAIVAWEEIDKPAARRFERQVAVAEARAELHREQSAQQETVIGWNTVAEKFAEEHPDVDKVSPKMREIAAQYPTIVAVLQSGDDEAKYEVLEFLYEKASRGQETDTRARAREIAREQAEGAEEAIREAHVASTTATVPAQHAPVGELIAAEWDKADAPYRDGWNV